MNFLAKRYIDFASSILSNVSKWHSQRRLSRIGLYLDFGKLPDGWIQAIHPADLTATWQKSGLQIEGVGYSTIGAITESQVSSRFVPDSTYYQAWLGGYLIRAESTFGVNQQGEPVFSTFAQIAIADQITWLKNYGCPNPEVSLVENSVRFIEKRQHQNYQAWFLEAEILSDSDIGNHNRYANGYFIYAIYEKMFERFGGVRLPLHSTLPPSIKLSPYHKIRLKGYFEIVEIPEYKAWAILYGCGTDWNGENRFLKLKDEVKVSIQKVKIMPL